jgi:hypothetical protein
VFQVVLCHLAFQDFLANQDVQSFHLILYLLEDLQVQGNLAHLVHQPVLVIPLAQEDHHNHLLLVSQEAQESL